MQADTKLKSSISWDKLGVGWEERLKILIIFADLYCTQSSENLPSMDKQLQEPLLYSSVGSQADSKGVVSDLGKQWYSDSEAISGILSSDLI